MEDLPRDALRDKIITRELISKVSDSPLYSVTHLTSDSFSIDLKIPDPNFSLSISFAQGNGEPTRSKSYLIGIFSQLYAYDNSKRQENPDLLSAFLRDIINRSTKVYILQELSKKFDVRKISITDESEGYSVRVLGVLELIVSGFSVKMLHSRFGYKPIEIQLSEIARY